MGKFDRNLRRLAVHERWWFWTWAVWGLLVAGIVACIDRSATASVVWVAGGVLAGIFGQSPWQWLCMALVWCSRRRELQGPSEFERRIDDPLLRLSTRSTLDIVNPRRKPWEVYPGTFVAVGLAHGILVGTVLGAISPVLQDASRSSFLGACEGLIAGPIVVCVMYAVVTPLMFGYYFRGPSIEPIRRTVWKAADEADSLGHEVVVAAHLLLAILREPTGPAAVFFEGHDILLPRSANYLRNQLNEGVLAVEYSEDDSSLFDTLLRAIDVAKALHHKDVAPAHLLLALLDVIPTETVDVLKKAGFTADEIQPRLAECLKATRGGSGDEKWLIE